MQPNRPSTPTYSGPPRPRSSAGPSVIGILVLLAFVYLVDQAIKGEAAVFSGVDRHISTLDFHGAQCIAVFGGCKMDLRDAQIQGRQSVLETYAIFGGVEIRVPEGWEVVNRGVAIFGGISDKRAQSSKGSDPKRLILEGAAIFVGVSVKN